MATELEVGPVDDLPPGKVTGVGHCAVGNTGTETFAVGRRCRHLRADLGGGSIDEDGCLVCPWHRAKYDIHTGKMVRGPRGVYERIPGFERLEKAITSVAPLHRGTVTERDGTLYVS